MIDMRQTILLLIILHSVVQIYCQENEKVTSYNPEELLLKIFNFSNTITPRQSNYGSVKFEDDFGSQIENSGDLSQITFEDESRPSTSLKFQNDPNVSFKFDDDSVVNNDDVLTEPTNNGFTFQDNNNIEYSKLSKKKRRKKPKNQNADYPTHIFHDDNKEPQRYSGPYQSFNFDQQTGPNNSFKFEGSVSHNYDNTLNIQQTNNPPPQDENKLEPKPPKKKRRRRRRKPRFQNQAFNQIQGYPNIPQGYPGFYPPPGYQVHNPTIPQGYPGNQGNPQGYPGQFAGNPQGFPGQHSYPVGPNGQYYRPPRRPKQSITSEALSAVTGALTSIALYDDYQCIPRLLCEAAGGGALGSSSVLQNVAGLQPLLTLLAAYNGISSSPLFIFGRAVFLGMTAKGNLGTCRYAYPQCPTDPEQLVHYLNNHNGGFFRFFNAPQLNNPQYGQQNVEQFYNQLSQNYGLYQAPDQSGNQQNYGFYQSNIPNQNYGVYQPNTNQQNNPIYQPNNPAPNNNPNFPSHPQSFGFPGANLYDDRPQSYGLQNYGATYPYQNNYGYNRFKNNNKKDDQNKIEKRIINGQEDHQNGHVDINDNPKWLSSGYNQNSEGYNNYRGGKELRFPGEEIQQQYNSDVTPDYNTRKGKGFSFPDNQNNIKYSNYYIESSTTQAPNVYGYFENKHRVENNTPSRYPNNNDSINKYTIVNQNFDKGNDEKTETVYILRGNGDPNHPEIVKLRPGEKLQ